MKDEMTFQDLVYVAARMMWRLIATTYEPQYVVLVLGFDLKRMPLPQPLCERSLMEQLYAESSSSGNSFVASRAHARHDSVFFLVGEVY